MWARRSLLCIVVALATSLPVAHGALFCAAYNASSDAFTLASADQPACTSAVNVIAYGEYNETLLTIGWDTLKWESNSTYNDALQARAAGFFEGALTAGRAAQFLQNVFFSASSPPIAPEVFTFLEENYAWVSQRAAQAPPTDRYWAHVNLTLFQLRGMMEGYDAAKANISIRLALLLAAQADYFDIPGSGQNEEDWRNMTADEFRRYLLGRSHCSSLVKVTPEFNRLYFGHTTWMSYGIMMRIYKTLTLNFHEPNTRARRVAYSSYPGALTSLDDFYITDSGFNVMETSLSVFNRSLYKYVVPQSVLSWMRVLVANRVATGGQDWYALFATENSGTYNNQWIVVDLSLFTPGTDLLPNTLWIVEQLPSLVVGRDQTGRLAYGYWPSYNIPYYEEVFNLAGYPEAIAVTHDWIMLDYERCCRAQMFREYQTNVDTIESMQWLMQYNNYLYDPIAQGNPTFNVAARGDLQTVAQGGPQFGGSIDSKVSEYAMAWPNGAAWAYMGPTPQPGIFAWNQFPAGAPGMPAHEGLPDSFNFSFVLMK